jgi:hypothetical protein
MNRLHSSNASRDHSNFRENERRKSLLHVLRSKSEDEKEPTMTTPAPKTAMTGTKQWQEEDDTSTTYSDDSSCSFEEENITEVTVNRSESSEEEDSSVASSEPASDEEEEEETDEESSFCSEESSWCSDDPSDRSCDTDAKTFASDGGNCKPTHREVRESFVYEKSLPSPTATYRVVCLSFLGEDIATSVASTVFDDSLRMLKPGGLLYVVDVSGRTVTKVPKMRQMLSRVTEPSVKHAVHDIHTKEILRVNGFSCDKTQQDVIVRWMGKKEEI